MTMTKVFFSASRKVSSFHRSMKFFQPLGVHVGVRQTVDDTDHHGDDDEADKENQAWQQKQIAGNGLTPHQRPAHCGLRLLGQNKSPLSQNRVSRRNAQYRLGCPNLRCASRFKKRKRPFPARRGEGARYPSSLCVRWYVRGQISLRQRRWPRPCRWTRSRRRQRPRRYPGACSTRRYGPGPSRW